MSILIAFLGGMLTLLSPCTLPVIRCCSPASGAAGAAGDHAGRNGADVRRCLRLVTVASGWVVNLTLAGRGLALAFFAPVGLSLLSQRVAQRLTSPR